MKIIAFYLPQFHEIPENNEWWGKGFTEWTNVKKAQPLFEGHNQPLVPLNGNYYDLGTGTETLRWQCKIARENGIYGFCFYHYWFNGHMLLQKPVDNYLKDRECDLPFCICWANENWTKAWVSKTDEVLMSQLYGDEEDWIEHFNYFLPFLKDDRYIRQNGRPILVIYRPELAGSSLNKMLDCWTRLAAENGIKKPIYAYQHPNSDELLGRDMDEFELAIEYQPSYALKDMGSLGTLRKIKRKVSNFTEKHFGFSINVRSMTSRLKGETEKLDLVDYDKVWEAVLSRKINGNKYVPGAFVNWDNSPRRGELGKIFTGASPKKFERYMERAIVKAREEYKKDMMFIFAWNEWTEGGYWNPRNKMAMAT